MLAVAPEVMAENGRIPTANKLGIVQSTINYKMFKLSPANRPIDPKHLMRLHDTIEKKNLLREFPIVVSTDMVVLDGQHRLKVAESLQVPIYYITTDRADVTDIADSNANTKHWKSEDYLHYYCNKNFLEYLKLRRYWETFNFMRLHDAVDMCFYGERVDGMSVQQRFARGLFQANDIPFAEKVGRGLLDFAPYTVLYKNATFIKAVRQLFCNSDYDHQRMVGKLKYLSAKLVRCATVELYLVVFTDIYNYKAREDNIVEFRKIGTNSAKYRADRKGTVAKSKQASK